MRTFQTDYRTFKIRIMAVDHCSLDCYSGVFISTLSKYLSDKLYHYTHYNFFLDYDTIGSRESSFFITDAS